MLLSDQGVLCLPVLSPLPSLRIFSRHRVGAAAPTFRRGGANLFFPCILYFATTAAVHGIRSRLVPLSFLFRFFPLILVDDQGAGALARWHSFVLILKKSNDVKVTSEGRDDAATADS